MKKIKTVISVFCMLLIIIPAGLILWRLWQYHIEDNTQKKVAEMIAEYTITEPSWNEENQMSIGMENFVDIKGLKEVNPDVEGYIKVDGTHMAYPVMKSKENDKYLRRDFYGKRSISGCIYMDNACYDGGTNLILYGHNMRNGTMFGEMKNYLDESFFNEHKKVLYITEDKITEYEICAVFSGSASDQELVQVLVPYTEDEFHDLVFYMKEHGKIMTEEPQWGDELITLATCEYSNKNGRLFVTGIKKKEILRYDVGTE